MEISKKSRVWIYQADRPFSLHEEHTVKGKLNDFVGQWEAHGNKLAAMAEVRYNRFIVLMVDEAQAGATGCSIDKSVSLMKQIENDFGVNLFDRFNIAYRNDSGIQSCGREAFEKLIAEGSINEETIVFNNLVQTIEDLDENWEVPFRKSWHSKVFGNLITPQTSVS